jgi:hypothetical protein
MLTGAVNIAVFAAFQPRIEGGLLSDRGFKRVCGVAVADSRQDRGKNGKMWQGLWQKWQGCEGRGHVLAIRRAAAMRRWRCVFCPYAVVQVLAARGGAM